MEIFTIKGENVILMYHPADEAADVGQQFAILERPQKTEGLIVQIISNDSVEYPGLQQEIIQKILEERMARLSIEIDREEGMGQIRNIKLALAKIRKRIHNEQWQRWDGWIPTRNVEISPVDADALIGNILPSPKPPTPDVPLRALCRFGGRDIRFNGPSLNMVNVITGVKGSGKSHIAKHLLLALAEAKVPCIVFDINGEYADLRNVQILRWGDNFIPDLAKVGYEMLIRVQQAVYPLKEASEATFQSRVKKEFEDRKKHCEGRNQYFSIDIDYLRSQFMSLGEGGEASKTSKSYEYIREAILRMLEIIDKKDLFLNDYNSKRKPITDFKMAFEKAAQGEPIVFDIRDLELALQSALVKSIHDMIEEICLEEADSGKGRFPFIFYEEAHFYVRDDIILNIITRGRHIGIGSIFVTNTPQKLPDTVFRQLDNLFLLNLTHKDDIRHVSKNSFTDEDTIESFATRLPERHALIVGNVTDRYPLVVEVLPLPPDIQPTGRTKSTWDRFAQANYSIENERLEQANDDEEVPF
jgi:KaiC/GvpD/RAD55 family RecA-like ATPase